MEEQFKGRIGTTYLDSVPHWRKNPTPPAGAPNVIFIVLDDVGFSDIGVYGSEIATPHMDRLARRGLQYTNFHVTAMCSPTRACLLTGRNAHTAGVGIISEWANGYPAYQGRISRKAGTLAEMLGPQGYGCYATGKWHLTNLADYGASGPHNDWPLGRGFSRWYGFHGALVDQWSPELYEDNHPFHLLPREEYHLSTDLVDRTIQQLRDHLTSAPDRPFFSYLAFGACHWPHQVPAEYIRKYAGRYDEGWDVVREQRLRKQLETGVIPPGTEMAGLNPGVQPWSEVGEDARKLACRLQETYSAFLEHTDAEIGRLVAYLEQTRQLDNTIIAVLSDNGASAEGGPTGAINMRKHMTHERETVESTLPRIDSIGGEHSFSHYPMGWAQVSNTPLKWYKKDTHGGGVRAPLIVHWPKGIGEKQQGLRTQFHHVIDIVPTILECAGLTAPAQINGVEQVDIHGASMAYSFDAAQASTAKRTQYFELLGDRGIWHEGWKAVAKHSKGADYDTGDRWELYHLDADYAEIHDLAAQQPNKLKALIALWWEQARRYGVLPLDDREGERARDYLMQSNRPEYSFQQGMARIDRFMVPEISDRDYSIWVDLAQTTPRTEGVVFSWGSRFAGFVLYAQDGDLVYEYYYSETKSYAMRVALRGPRMAVELRFRRTGENAGVLDLLVDQQLEASLTLPKTWWTYSTTAGLTCGLAGVPISDAFRPPFPFSAVIESMRVRPGEANGDTAASKVWTVFLQQ